MSYFDTGLQSSSFNTLFSNTNAMSSDTDTNLMLPTPSSTLHQGNGAESFNNPNRVSPDMQHPFDFVNDNDPVFDMDLGVSNFTDTQQPFDFFSDNDANLMNMQRPFEVTDRDGDFNMGFGSSTLTTTQSGPRVRPSFSSPPVRGTMLLGERGFGGPRMSSQENVTMLQDMDDDCLSPGMQGLLNYLDNRHKHQGANIGQRSQPASVALHSQTYRNTSSGQQSSLPASQSRHSSTQHKAPVQGSRVTKTPASKAAATVKEARQTPKKRSTPKKSSPKAPKTTHVNLLRGAPSSVIAAHRQGNSMVNISVGSPIPPPNTRIQGSSTANASRGSPGSLPVTRGQENSMVNALRGSINSPPTTRVQRNSIANASRGSPGSPSAARGQGNSIVNAFANASRGSPIHLPVARVQENSMINFTSDPQLSPSFEDQMRASLGSYLNDTEQTFESYMDGEQEIDSYMGQAQTDSTAMRPTTSPVQRPRTGTSTTTAQAPTPAPAPAPIVDTAAAELEAQSQYLETLVQNFVNSPALQQQFMDEYGYSEERLRRFSTSVTDQHNMMRRTLQNPGFQRMIADNIGQPIPSYGAQRQRNALARARQLSGRRR